MERKRMTDSELISRKQEEERRRSNARQLFEPNLILDQNTCWMYQLELERLLKRLLPDERMHGRFVTLLSLLSTQARKASDE